MTGLRSWNAIDSAGVYGPAGANTERAGIQRRIDRWLRANGVYKLTEVLVVSDEFSVDGRLVLKNGRPVPSR